MGPKAKGPCNHCGATESVMWRRGPESKPVLCNACGARWIVKKTLEGYLPQSAGGSKKRAKPKTKRQNTTAPRTAIVSSKRVRKAPRKYEDAESPSSSKASKRAGSGSILRLNLDNKHVKVVSGIPSPLKPAKKRASVRKIFFKNEFAGGLPVGRGSLDCRSRDSLLGNINLSRIINSDTFYNILSENDRESLMKWLPEKDKNLLSSTEESTSGDKEGRSNSVFVNDQILSSMVHYQDLLKDGLLEESSSQLWIPSKLARAEKTSRIDKPEFFIPQLGDIIYGENIPNKLLGIN